MCPTAVNKVSSNQCVVRTFFAFCLAMIHQNTKTESVRATMFETLPATLTFNFKKKCNPTFHGIGALSAVNIRAQWLRVSLHQHTRKMTGLYAQTPTEV